MKASHWVMSILLLLALPALLLAEIPITDRVTLDGNMRWRWELSDRDFNADSGPDDYATLRTQIGVRVQASDNLLFRVKLKEPRLIGTQQSNSAPPQTNDVVHMQEAFAEVTGLFGKPLDLRVGRFEFYYGRRRVFGTGGWNVNGPRTYDAVRTRFHMNDSHVELVVSKTDDRTYTATPADLQDRRQIILAANMLDGDFQPMIWADLDPRNTPGDNGDIGEYRITPALYYHRGMGDFSFTTDLAFQLGRRDGVADVDGDGSLDEQDVSAWLVVLTGMYRLSGPMEPEVGITLDMTSGNAYNDPADEDNVFRVPFMSRHAWRGYMDFFQDVPFGMMDAVLHLKARPYENTQASLNIHNFRYMQNAARVDPATGAVTEYKQLGQELDMRVQVEITDNYGLDAAYCLFLPTEDWQPSGDLSHFFYLALTARF